MTENRNFDAVDAVIARKLRSVEVPPDLRARLLALTRAGAAEVREAGGPAWVGSSVVLALAALVALALVVLGTLGPVGGGGTRLATASTELAEFLATDFAFSRDTESLPEVAAWLAEHGVGRAEDLPAVVKRLAPLGCTEITWDGIRGTLICFDVGSGKVAHLFMFPQDAMGVAPGPMFAARVGPWRRMAWSRDGMTYLLFAPWDSPALS